MSTTSATAGRYAAPFHYRTEVRARNWWPVLQRGVLAIGSGLIALLFPGQTMLALVLVFAIYVLVDEILAIIAMVRAEKPSGGAHDPL